MLLGFDESRTCREAVLDGTVLDGTALDGTALDGTALDGAALDGAVLDREAACSRSGCLLFPCPHSQHFAELSGSGVNCSQSQPPPPPLQNSFAIIGDEWDCKGPEVNQRPLYTYNFSTSKMIMSITIDTTGVPENTKWGPLKKYPRLWSGVRYG